MRPTNKATTTYTYDEKASLDLQTPLSLEEYLDRTRSDGKAPVGEGGRVGREIMAAGDKGLYHPPHT